MQEGKNKTSVSLSPQNQPFNQNNPMTTTTTTMAGDFSSPHLLNSRSLSSIINDPENSINQFPLRPILSLSQSDLSSCDADPDPETRDFDLEPMFEPLGLGCDYRDENDDQVSFVTNLFDRSSENGRSSDSPLGLELGLGNNEVDLELGLGFGVSPLRQPAEETRHFEGLRVVSVDSESDFEDEYLGDFDDVGSGFDGVSDFDRPPFCWDHLGFNNRRSDTENLELGRVNDNSQRREREIELSDIVAPDDDDDDDGGAFFFGGCHNGFDEDDEEDNFENPLRLDDFDGDGHREAGVESILFDNYQGQEEQEVMIQSDAEEEVEFGVEDAIRDLEWEILLAVNNFNREVHDMGFNVDMYEAILGEVEDHMNDWKGSPPAAHSVIENLPTVRFSREGLEENSVVCAICKDEVSGEEMVRQLPCLHYYHGDCIVPWLKMRNTCPVCRHELPTDDPEYEYRKREREELIADGDVSQNSQADYDFHVFL
uniref:RING-type E3 ubiquitin transferase n=1 Tax=Opuntia streptacantha TaxID=393608 RepID=A0A7C9CD13_OPUST